MAPLESSKQSVQVFLSNNMGNKGFKVEISKMQYIPGSFSP